MRPGWNRQADEWLGAGVSDQQLWDLLLLPHTSSAEQTKREGERETQEEQNTNSYCSANFQLPLSSSCTACFLITTGPRLFCSGQYCSVWDRWPLWGLHFHCAGSKKTTPATETAMSHKSNKRQVSKWRAHQTNGPLETWMYCQEVYESWCVVLFLVFFFYNFKSTKLCHFLPFRKTTTHFGLYGSDPFL